MTETNYGEPDFNITVGTVGDYVHPVLTQLNDKIAKLEKQLAEMTEREDKQRSRAWELSSNFANYKFKLENVLRTYAQDNSATAELFVEIANEMDIELVNTKDFEINVTFNVTVAAPFGEEIELSEYDISAVLDDISGVEFEVNDFGVNYINED
jgi:hypothetical protein